MNIAIDVDYRADGCAVAAGILFPDWASATIAETVIRTVPAVAPYTPGRFFERELPCLLAVIAALPAPPATVVIDGHAVLDAAGRPGLGAHLFAALGGTIPVIGVAKTRFRDTPAEAAVLRGGSSKPLYVTAVGLDAALARARIRDMHGAHRIPTILAAADRACRTAGPGSSATSAIVAAAPGAYCRGPGDAGAR